MPELTTPRLELHAAWLEAHREWGPGLHEDGFGIGADDDVESIEGFAAWLHAAVRSPGRRWWITENGTVLGGIALRSADDERVPLLGHVGYGIRPSARRRGLATWALGQVLAQAALDGINPVLAVCHEENLASVGTLEHWGGRLTRTVVHADVRVRHYARGPGDRTARPRVHLRTPSPQVRSFVID